MKTTSAYLFVPPFVVGLFLFTKVLEDLGRLNLERAAFMMIPVGVFWGIAWILWAQVLNRSQQFGVPPDTIVSSSLTFSPRIRKLFEPQRRRFEFRNEVFAAAFIEANRNRLWDPRSTKAINARNNRTLLQYGAIAVAVVFFAWALIDDFMS